MTSEPFIAHSELTNEIYIVTGKEKYRVTEQAIKAVMAIKALEQEPTTQERQAENDKFDAAFQDGYNNGYAQARFDYEQESTAKNDLGVDCISRDDVRDVMQELWGTSGELMDRLMVLPSVTPQEPKTGHCRDCKWWKDSDGVYRRGVGAESQCPINRKEVYEGNGYCFLYEPRESEGGRNEKSRSNKNNQKRN